MSFCPGQRCNQLKKALASNTGAKGNRLDDRAARRAAQTAKAPR